MRIVSVRVCVVKSIILRKKEIQNTRACCEKLKTFIMYRTKIKKQKKQTRNEENIKKNIKKVERKKEL